MYPGGINKKYYYGGRNIEYPKIEKNKKLNKFMEWLLQRVIIIHNLQRYGLMIK